MSFERGLRYESGGFGFHENQFMSSESFGRQFDGNYMENSINNLYSQVEVQDNQRFSTNDIHTQNFGDAFLGSEATGSTLQALLTNFGDSVDLEPRPPYTSVWPAAAQVAPAPQVQPELGINSAMMFPSQVLTQNSRDSPFPDTTESSLFSSCSNLSRVDLPPTSTFSSFSTSSLMSSQSSGKIENSLGLSDITTRLEELSQGSLITSQGCSTRDSTPLSWNPIANYSSKTNSSTPSPILQEFFKNVARPVFPPVEDDVLFPQEEGDLSKVTQNPSPPEMKQQHARDRIGSIRNMNRPKLHKSMSTSCVPEPVQSSGPGPTSWSNIVRSGTSSTTKLPGLASPVTRARLAASPSPLAKEEPQLVVEEVPPTTNTVDFHRGPKVDPRWPVSQQVFLGPIPMSITWDEIRNVFYTKVQRRELLHFYVQSKPVNEVVYGQVVLDKPALANKVVKDGPVKVRGHLIQVTLMKERAKAEKKK